MGEKINGIEVISPSRLKQLKNIPIIITSSFTQEISKQLQEMGISNIHFFTCGIEPIATWNTPVKRLDIPMIDLGDFLGNLGENIKIDDMTFMTGGSTILDYAFLKALIMKFRFKTYLEIGTWMGESIAAISELADTCYSISLPDDDIGIVEYFKNVNKKNNFSRYFSYKKKNIVHYKVDSKKFDFTSIQDHIDLVFIDGDHTYEGVKTDTENIFKMIDIQKTIVVWHDFKNIRNEFLLSTVQAIHDALPEHLHKNIFGVDNNMCGVYIPKQYLHNFSFNNDPDVIYSYETTISTKRNKRI